MPRQKTVTISEADAAVLRRETWTEDLYVLPSQLDRPDYVRVNKVLETLGGKWNRYRRGHVFPETDRAVLQEALQQGFVVDQKRSLGQFDTPDDVADRVVEAAAMVAEPGHSVSLLEPSAGQGSLLWAVRRALADRIEIAADVVELDEKRATQLREQVAPALLKVPSPFSRVTVHQADFLTWKSPPGDRYQVILANPPFGHGEDTRHVSRMIDLLAPGGVLSAVMAGSLSFRDSQLYQSLRDKLSRECPGWSVRDLPLGAFAAAGTQVSTVLVVARKFGSG